jgi:hypothetical protein
MNLGACARLRTGPEAGVWYRAVEPNHLRAALATAHTVFSISRFSPATPAVAAFPVLYLAENQLVALFEVGALVAATGPGGVLLPNPRQAWTILNVQVSLQNVADLCDVAEQTKLSTTAQELTGDWRAYYLRTPLTPVRGPTQDLGQALYQVAGLEGFLTVSAKMPTHRNLVVFPNKLHPGSHILFSDSATGQTHTIP